MKSIEEQGPEPRLPGLTQYTPEQLFFVSFSQVSMILDFSKILISTPPMALSNRFCKEMVPCFKIFSYLCTGLRKY